MIMSMTPRTIWTPDTAWAAVLTRNPASDGDFVFAVRTTGIYCRPSCPARRPKQTNVAFFDDGASAREAGYRACRRCRPDQPAKDPVGTAHRLLETLDERLTLSQLAAKVAMSAGHLQRRFKARYGLSPRAFQEQRRKLRLRSALRGGLAVSRASYDAGYGSSSRVYERAAGDLGMTPGQFARGAKGLTIRYTIIDSYPASYVARDTASPPRRADRSRSLRLCSWNARGESPYRALKRRWRWPADMATLAAS